MGSSGWCNQRFLQNTHALTTFMGKWERGHRVFQDRACTSKNIDLAADKLASPRPILLELYPACGATAELFNTNRLPWELLHMLLYIKLVFRKTC